MSLFFDVINNGKLLPFGCKSDTSQNSVFNSTMSDVFIGFYPNNSNDCDFDNYKNNISLGSSNINDYHEGYISTKNNKLIKFNDYNIITNVDIISYNNSLGNESNIFNTLSISSNIFLNNLPITSLSSNIYIVNDLLTNNLNILNDIFTELLISSNLFTNNLNINNLYTSNIYSSNIITKNLLTSNLISNNNSYIYYINANNINTNLIYSSNIKIYDTLITSNLNANTLMSSYIFTSNIINSNTLITNTLNISSNNFLGNININNDILPLSDDIYNIGSQDSSFSNIYLHDSIISESNILRTSLSNIIINNNLIIDNAYLFTINANTLIVNNITNINKNCNDIFKDIINTNNIYTNIIITSNVSSLNNIISKNIISKNIKTDNYISTDFNILGLIYNNNISTKTINTSNIYTSNFQTDNATIYNLNIPHSSYQFSFIDKLVLTNKILSSVNNIINIGSSNNTWNSIYISSNIFLNDTTISSQYSNIIFNNNLNSSNIITSNITSDYITVNNIYTSNIISSSNINSLYINTNGIILSNIINYDTIFTNSLNSINNIKANFIYTSNINIIYSIYGNIINNDIANIDDIYVSSNINNSNTINTSNITITNGAYINKLILPNNFNPSQCNIYNLGSQNNKWKDIYLTSNSVYLGDYVITNNNQIDIKNTSNIYQSIILNNIILGNSKVNININDKNQLSFVSSNLNNKTLSYNNINNLPSYSSCNFILNNIIASNNSIFYNNVNINSTPDINTLNVNGNVYSTYFKGSYIGNMLNVSNILSTNIISNLLVSNGAFVIPEIIFNNNTLFADNVKSSIINSIYYGNGYNISNIFASNIINNLTYNGTGCNTINKNSIIVGNNSNSIIVSPNLTFDNINNILNINNGIIIADNISTNSLIINSNIFIGNASKITNIISSNINGILYIDNGSIFYNIYSNIGLNDNGFNIDGNIYANNIYSYYIGEAINISNIISSNIINSINISQGGINNTFGLSNIVWDNINNILSINNIKSSILTSEKFIGDAKNISNINAININNILSLSINNGGLSNNILNLNQILFYDNNIHTSPNIYIIDSNLIIKGSLVTNKLNSPNFITSGENISNINANNIINNIQINSGGTNTNKIQKNNLLFYDNNIINNTSDLYWNNNKLNINGVISTYYTYSQNYIGDANNVSNIYSSNFNNNYSISLNQGGTGLNNIGYGNVLIGNNINNILSYNDLSYSNSIFYSKKIIAKSSSINTVNAPIIYSSKFIGDAKNISNINNIIDIVPILNGGTSMSNITKGLLILNSNILWDNNKLIINGNIYASHVYSQYSGDIANVSNIYSSNIIYKINDYNGGLINYINYYSNITFDNSNIILTINNGSLYANQIKALYYGDATNVSNIITSNILNIVIQNNILKDYLLGNDNNIIINSSVTSITINSNIYSDKIYSSKYYGNGDNISNIKISNNFIDIVKIIQGGFNCNIINKNYLIYGNYNSISATSNITFNSNILNINGTIVSSKNINSIYNGDATNISNIQATQLKGTINNFLINYINYYSNITWNNNLKKLTITGNIYGNKIYSSVLSGNGANISNINSINITSLNNNSFKSIIGTTNISNIYWDNSNNSLNITNKIYSYINYGKFIGNGNNISNIYVKNILSYLLNSNGGTGLTNIPINNILIGNNETIMVTDNLKWNNNKLYINSNLVSKNIISSFIGNGNISNININNGCINISQGGLGCNNIDIGNIIVGNNSNPIIISSNLYWDINNNSLKTINLIASKIIANNFIGSYNNISNIIASNISNRLNAINGIFGCNIIPSSCILIGNNSNIIITTDNLSFNNNLYSINLKTGALYNNGINSKNIYSSKSIQSKFIGDGINISNIILSNLNNNTYITILNGGLNINNNKSGNILLKDYLSWDIVNNNFIVNSNIIAKNINSIFIGDGNGINNINSSNLIYNTIITNGGLGSNNIPIYNLLIGNGNSIITTSNLSFINKTLIIKGDIKASNYYGYGIYNVSSNDTTNIGNNYTKLLASNMYKTQTQNVNTYGKIYYGNNNNIPSNSSNIFWNFSNNSLNIYGDINVSNYIYSKYNAIDINNIIPISKGGFGINSNINEYIFYGNDSSVSYTSNLIWKNNNNILITAKIYANNIQGTLYGDAYNISNINSTKLYNIISFKNGGTGKSLLEYGNILIGNNSNNIITNPKLYWDNILNIFKINKGDIIPSDNIYSKFGGNGNKLSNISILNRNLNSIDGLIHGCTGRIFITSNQILVGNDTYPIITTKNFKWDIQQNTLKLKGTIYAKNIYTNIVYNLKASEFKGILSIYNGGTNVNNINTDYLIIGSGNSNSVILSSNINWINNINTFNINGNIYSKNIKGSFIGDGKMLSNIYASNFNSINTFLKVSQGGLGSNYFIKNNILVGNNNEILNNNLLSFNSNLYINDIYNNSIFVNKLYGDGNNLSNLNISNISNTFNSIYGGTSCNLLSYCQILIGNNSNAIFSTSNILWNINNSLNINNNVTTKDSYGKFYGDGNNLSNINYSNIINNLYIENGGLFSNYINSGYIIIGNGDKIITSSNLTWDNSNNLLTVNDNIYVNNIIGIYTYGSIYQSLFKGDGLNISNYNSSNFIYYTSVLNGGTGFNNINKGYLLTGYGNKIITTSNLYWNDNLNSININGYTNANTYYVNKLYGDGQNISNYIFYASNMILSDILSVINGGTGLSNINYNEILFGNNTYPLISSSNLKIDNNNLILDGILNSKRIFMSGGIIAKSYQGMIYGDGIELSNIISSNLISSVPVINYGTGYSNAIAKGQLLVGNNNNTIITTSNLLYNIDTNILYINGIINTSNISLTNNINIVNCICSNNITISNNGIYNKLYGNKISTENLIGNGINLSNINIRNINNLNLDVINGGLGCNQIPLGQLLIGNYNSIITTSNLLWDNNLLINGDIEITCNISINNVISSSLISKNLLGDANNIYNYNVSAIKGILPVTLGGTGSNYINNCQIIVGNSSNAVITTSNLLWNNTNKYLYINGNILTLSLSGSDTSSYNLYSSNLFTVSGISYYNTIITNTIQGKYIGDGNNLSNIDANNLISININNLDKGSLLIGNNNTLTVTSNIIWDNDNKILSINDIIYSKNINNSNIYAQNVNANMYYGNGYNISNINVNNIIGCLDVKYGGTGSNNINSGYILVGNSSNALIATSNLYWYYSKYVKYILSITGSLNANTLNSKIINGSNIIGCNIIVNNASYHNNILSKIIQSSYIGDGINISNIVVSNINNYILNISNGGYGVFSINSNSIIIGNGNSIITSSNIIWNNNNLSINGEININNLLNNSLNISTVQSSLYIGDGELLSNINVSTLNNLNNVSNNILLNVINGGTGYSNINGGCLLIGNNSNTLIVTSNILWNKNNNYLYVNNKINANIISSTAINSCNIICSNIYNTGNKTTFINLNSKSIQSSYYGNGINISNLQYNNFKGVIKYINGGTNSNFITYGNILIGNGNNNGILNTSNLKWDNNLIIIGDIYNISSLYKYVNISSGYASYLYGNGENISNILTTNINGILPISCSGTGCNIINNCCILIGNDKNPLIISSNIYWNKNTIIINNSINVNDILSSNNIYCSNIILNNLDAPLCYLNNLITTNTYSSIFIGDSLGLSNISTKNINNVINVLNGGTSYSNIIKGSIIIGNNSNSILVSSNLIWDNDDNKLTINGDIYLKNIYNKNKIVGNNINASYLIGDGINISNIYVNNIKGVLPVYCSGTGCNFINYGRLLIGNNSNDIITSPNLIWSNIDNSININGIFKTSIIVVTNPLITSDIITCNINLNISSSYNNIYSSIIQSKYYGNALNISNINIQNFNGILSYNNGGTSSNSFINGNILYGGGNSILESCNISYNNNNLLIKGNININNSINNIIYTQCSYNSYIRGDGINLSNINIKNIKGQYNIINSGTGRNFINFGNILIGNDINPINFSSNLLWYNNGLYINSNLNINTISTVRLDFNNYITSNIIVSGISIFSNINAQYIQSKFYGNGENCSNISLNKIIGLPSILSSNNISYGNIIVGNGLNTINISSNLSWYNNTLYSTNIINLNLKGNYCYHSNLDIKYLFINKKYVLKNIFYLSLNITSMSPINTYNYVPFNINTSLSSININDYWKNNCFIPPVNGLYSFYYSICVDSECIIWINKGTNFSNNYRHGSKYVGSDGSINIMMKCSINDNIYFGIKSLSNYGNILLNNVGNTSASIALLQYY